MKEGTVLILGARSDIGMALAHRYARAGYDVQIAARNHETLFNDVADLSLRYQSNVTAYEFDALDIASHPHFVTNLPVLPDIAISTVGYLGNQPEAQTASAEALLIMRSNFEGPASILEELAHHFEKRGSGCIIGISSVAGERGRASNYIYGSSKAGFTAYLSGLRNRLAKGNVQVLTVLPGFVDTKMTAGMNLPRKLTASSDEVAEAIYHAAKSGKNVVYVRKIWKLIMLLIRNIPEPIFKKMNI
ncbi:MAG TPA: short-chain dehydrogenase [Alphaproteobacteria bacterium]|nr:short-chain dehydrogenase [Alphaproteobacteria bacterium]HCY47432.1 short-chain dehydrogenase [Alphaproteobacteria bacterium]